MWPITLSGRLPIVGLVGRYLTNYLMGRELTPDRIAPLTPSSCDIVVLCGISSCFQLLSPCLGQIAHALLTRPPLEHQDRSPNVPARLACVRHAASVRPEPGSNSSVQSSPLPRANGIPAFRSSESDCSFILPYIVFKDRARRALSLDGLISIPNADSFVKPFVKKITTYFNHLYSAHIP